MNAAKPIKTKTRSRLFSAAQTSTDSVNSRIVIPPEFDIFPGSVKHLILQESDYYFFSLAIVQETLKMIPKSEPFNKSTE